jgi:DNA-binding NarL/FixJ family response regulator
VPFGPLRWPKEQSIVIDLFIIDDQPATRAGVRMLLELEPDIRVVGEAGDPVDALAQLESLRPQLILLDLALKETDGIDLVAAIRARDPQRAVIILTLHDNANNRRRAAEAGVAKFIGKHEGSPALLAAIRSAF